MRSFVVAKMFVINDQGEVLALRRSQTDSRRPGQLDFPGGGVDPGEDMREAAIRETVEETGLTVTEAQLVYARTEMTDEHGSGTWLAFVTHVTGQPEVTLSFEHDAFAWKQPTELLEAMQYPRQRAMLEYVMEHNLLEPEDVVA